ncbi:sensor histidine kinase [Pararhodonellum marinum]|uniref:sensor histidine kinase n=1 Tax=Pararhodonellum marinum TaxID=2755358 RepID=UPI0018906A88|nr:histidine kinase [Pararhodonellum marinum]
MKNVNRLSHKQRYWLLHIGGWLGLVFVETINYTFFIVREFKWEFVIQFLIMAIIGIVVSHFYKVWMIKPKTFELSSPTIWTKAFLDVLLISTALVIFSYLPVLIANFELLEENWKEAAISFFGQIMNIARYVVVWIIIYYLYKIRLKNQEITEKVLKAENLAKTSELELLKTQLNPHFLFNALNSIKALVLVDSEKARTAIIKLSELLRFTLNYEKSPLISIEEEFQEVEKYLELEKIRFGNRLTYKLDMLAAVQELKIPPAMVLTLTENAIKHGITQLPDGGNISIKATLEQEAVLIEVFNSGELKAKNLNGIGLQNIQKRLLNLFGENARFALNQVELDGVLATLIFPVCRDGHLMKENNPNGTG